MRQRLQWRAAGLKGFYFSLSSVAPAKLHQRKMLHCRIYLHLHSRVWQQLKGVLLCIFNALNQPVWWWQAFVKLCSDLSRLANQPPPPPPFLPFRSQWCSDSLMCRTSPGSLSTGPPAQLKWLSWLVHTEILLWLFIGLEKISALFDRMRELEMLL